MALFTCYYKMLMCSKISILYSFYVVLSWSTLKCALVYWLVTLTVHLVQINYCLGDNMCLNFYKIFNKISKGYLVLVNPNLANVSYFVKLLLSKCTLCNNQSVQLNSNVLLKFNFNSIIKQFWYFFRPLSGIRTRPISNFACSKERPR